MQTKREYLTGREINSLRCESTGEYTLPDYNGDVKKVMTVKTKIFPSEKFVSDDSLDFSGTVLYEVVYIDADNNITHAEFTTDYDAAVRINSQLYVDSDVETAVSSCNMRIVGPRKLSVKCTLDSCVKISERKTYEVDGDAFVSYEPEVLTSSVDSMCFAFAKGEQKELGGEILRIEGAIEDEVEILLIDSDFELTSLSVDDNEANIKGRVKVNTLYRNNDGAPCVALGEFNLEDTIVADGIDASLPTNVRADVVGLRGSVEPNEDGVSITASFGLSLALSQVKNEQIEVVIDSYLKERGCENDYTDLIYTEHVCTERHEADFSVKVPLDELGIDGAGDIVWCNATAKVDFCDIEENSVKINGEIRFSGIACQVSDENTYNYFPVKLTTPFKQNVNVNCQKHDNMHSNCSVTVSDVKMELSENGVNASCVLLLSVTLVSERRQRCIGASFVTEEEYLGDDSLVTVYYPDSSESLFDIAKRYHTSVASIAESNRLAESVFAASGDPVLRAGVKKLIIK